MALFSLRIRIFSPFLLLLISLPFLHIAQSYILSSPMELSPSFYYILSLSPCFSQFFYLNRSPCTPQVSPLHLRPWAFTYHYPVLHLVALVESEVLCRFVNHCVARLPCCEAWLPHSHHIGGYLALPIATRIVFFQNPPTRPINKARLLCSKPSLELSLFLPFTLSCIFHFLEKYAFLSWLRCVTSCLYYALLPLS